MAALIGNYFQTTTRDLFIRTELSAQWIPDDYSRFLYCEHHEDGDLGTDKPPSRDFGH